MAKGSIIACQLSYLPVKAKNYLEEVDKVLEIIRGNFPDAEIGDMSTLIKGKREIVLDLIDKIMAEMDKESYAFTMQISLSNVCGCS